MEPIQFIDKTDYAKLQADSDLATARPNRFTSVRYDETQHRIALGLARGVEIVVPVSEIGELARASVAHLKALRLTPSGEALILATGNVHISTAGLLRDLLGLLPQGAIAAQFAALGGARRSSAKKAAAALNGKLGGRPKKNGTAS